MLLTIAIFILVLYIVLGFKMPRFAIITLPVIASVVIMVCAGKEVLAPSIISLFIFPVGLIAILFTRHEQDVTPWPKQMAKTALMVLFAFFLMIVFFNISFLLGTMFLAFLGLLLGYCIGMTVIQRNSTVAFVISTIGASVRQNLPLPMALQSASEDIKYKHSQILRQISKWLIQGYSLSESIKRGFRKCPAKITALIAAGEKIGQVPEIVQSIESDLLQKAADNTRIRPVYPAAYFITVMLIMSFIVLGLMIGVIPKFGVIIREMIGGELPKSTRILIDISNYIVYGNGWMLVFGVIFLSSIFYIAARFGSRIPEKPRLLSRIGDFIKWRLPIFRWFENNYSTLQVVEVLRMSLNSGTTLNEAIRNTIGLDVNYCFRKKLKEWLRLVESGENTAQAVKRCGLANSLCLAFERQSNPESTLAILEMLESVYRSNYSYRVNLARFILLPCTTILLGAMVGFVAYSVFSAIVQIIVVCSNFV